MAASAALAGVQTGLTVAQPYLGMSPLALAALIGSVTCASSLAGIVARIIQQKGL
jgi:hypothetical protein